MRGWAGALLAVLWLLGAAGACLAAAPAPAAIGVKLGDQAGNTRVTIELSGRVPFHLFTLPTPYRIVLDLPEINWRVPDQPNGHGLVAGFRFGLYKPGNSRIVLDLAQPARVVQAALVEPARGKPFRLQIDLEAIEASKFRREEAGTRPRNIEPVSMVVPLADPKRKPPPKPVIVLDPGHGGIDPGAIGYRGHYEKHITLAMARAVRDRLNATGRYRVHLTRDSDVFIPLRGRIEKARNWGADLFISLHADSISRSAVRGLSVYTLSEQASDMEAAALAAKENKSDLIAGVDLKAKPGEVVNILIDLAQRETKNFSAQFAAMVVDAMEPQVALLPGTHRFAGFAVLKAPDVPSVLIELGYMSNPTDEKLLLSATHRKRVAEGLADAIANFFAMKERLRGL